MADSPDALGDWLALREPEDAIARSSDLTAAVAAAVPAERPLRALDLATGTGSNIRYLGSRLPAPQQWMAIDRDPVLLAEMRVADEARRAGVAVETRQLELGVLDPAMFGQRGLVTASALLDLVSGRWIEQLAACCFAARSVVLFALSYDGRFACDPKEPEDDLIRELFNRHQRASDKGFGTAAGPDAANAASDAFARVGYEMRQERSDWRLTPRSARLQRLLIAGWAGAAGEIAPDRRSLIDDWLRRRVAHVQEGRSSVVVGHVDLGGWPVR